MSKDKQNNTTIKSTYPASTSGLVVSSQLAYGSYEDSLDAYLHRIAQIPLLSAEEEYAYAKQYQETGDVDAAQYLVMSNLRFVVYIAKGFKGYGLPLADIIQEGNLGLMKAVKRFDPDKSVRFLSYAVYWIRCDINEYIIKNMRMVKAVTSKNKRKILFNLGKHLREKQGVLSASDRADIAQEYGVKVTDIEAVESALTAADASIDARNEQGVSMSEQLPDHSQSPAALIESKNTQDFQDKAIASVLGQLNDRQREIIERRWLAEKKCSLESLAEEYGISMQRVSQIEKQALAKCYQLLQGQGSLLLAEEA
ncbi:RNA polymerase factor sigma-32 [Candidatus Comchoanobacter bicostacola]|uniref:RNA polymerase factor sigma-32 n=1 Tax=Candidatus Comchoanobacter bicostacola TaxID=2919598 RepID=A0ABY5DKC4_9GAMM|nr:RNA polymerase factor sigma-32 [Candidatus Comchoanobacter bicostacola]UTC24605.1 RNA polymerase factor sigma-32 [Candidatus Comchoanobacter bicostacola]